MDRDVPKFIAREVLVPLLLTCMTAILGWTAININDLRVDIAVITEKVVQHERRISILESKKYKN